MIKLTRIQWPVWNWVNILIYFFISVSVQAENSFVVVEKSPAVRPGVDHHPITNCEIFIQPFAQPLCLIETLQIVSNTSRLFIYIAPFLRISDPLNTISSQFVASKHSAIVFIWPKFKVKKCETSSNLDGCNYNTIVIGIQPSNFKMRIYEHSFHVY